MKKLLVIAGLVMSLSSFAQAGNNDDVANALKKVDISSFNSYFDAKIDVKLPTGDEAKAVDKDAAGATVKEFFDKNGIKGFELTSQRAMGGTMYLTGKLTGGTKPYNITVMMKNKDSKVYVITVRIN